MPLPQLQLLKHFRRRSTTVIANPWRPQGLSHTSALLKTPLFRLHGNGISIRADRRQHQSQHLSPTSSAPTEEAMGERCGRIPGQLVGAEPTHPLSRCHRRQSRPEAKTVGQPSQGVTPLREGATAMGLPESELLPQRRRAYQHTIGFHPWAIDRFPTPGSTGGADALPQRRPELLHPLIKRWSGVGKTQLGESIHQIESRAEGAFRRLPGIGHRPQPGQIQVGMTDPVQASLRP